MKNGTGIYFLMIFWLTFGVGKTVIYEMALFSSILSISHANHCENTESVRWIRESHEKWSKTVYSDDSLAFIWGGQN
jgi:hypothetical protein